MNILTVGYLEDQLRNFPKETEISVSCNCCHHSSIGSKDIITIEDNTNQTFGYIALNINSTVEPDIERAIDKEEFYKAEIKRLKAEKKEAIEELSQYKNKITAIYHLINDSI